MTPAFNMTVNLLSTSVLPWPVSSLSVHNVSKTTTLIIKTSELLQKSFLLSPSKTNASPKLEKSLIVSVLNKTRLASMNLDKSFKLVTFFLIQSHQKDQINTRSLPQNYGFVFPQPRRLRKEKNVKNAFRPVGSFPWTWQSHDHCLIAKNALQSPWKPQIFHVKRSNYYQTGWR